jgi:hypothetical protein
LLLVGFWRASTVSAFTSVGCSLLAMYSCKAQQHEQQKLGTQHASIHLLLVICTGAQRHSCQLQVHFTASTSQAPAPVLLLHPVLLRPAAVKGSRT